MTIRKPKRFLALLLSVLVAAELVVSVVMGTFAATEPTKEVTKQLLDFSSCEVKNTVSLSDWPEGLEPADYTLDEPNFQYNDNGFRVDIREGTDGKYIRFNFNKTNGPGTVQNIKLRGNDAAKIFLKASIPAKYIKYLKSIKFDYSYYYNKSGRVTEKNLHSFYVFGVTDGTTFSTAVPSSYTGTGINTSLHNVLNKGSAVVSNSVEMNVTDLIKCTDLNARNFLGAVQNAKTLDKWDATDLEAQENLDVILMFSPPTIAPADRNKGYYLDIKGISVDIEGPEDEIDNIDQLAPLVPEILNFEEGADLAEIKENNTVGFDVTDNSDVTTEGAFAGKSLLYKHWKTTGSKLESNLSFKLDGDQAVQSKGLTFVVKNVSDTAKKVRVWFAPNSNSSAATNVYGKYQYVFNLPASMTEYKTINIPWDNLGIMEFQSDGQWWNNSTFGYSIAEKELASGLGVSIRADVKDGDVGIMFDEFKHMTEKVLEGESTTLIDFSNANVGKTSILNPLPVGVEINPEAHFEATFEKYNGTTEIVSNLDGTKSLALNYDKAANWLAGTDKTRHQLYSRPFYMVAVNVPKGSLNELSNIQFELSNKTERYNSDRYSEDSIHYNICIGDSESKAYTRFAKSVDIDSQIGFKGNNAVSVNMSDMFKTGPYGMAAWSNPTGRVYLTEEDYKSIDTIMLLISAPISDTTDNGSILVNSITLTYKNGPTYGEKTREIAAADDVQKLTSGKISADLHDIKANDPNYVEFTTSHTVEVKDAANTERLVYKSNYYEYIRNAYPFYKKGTGQMHLFGFAEKDIDLAITLIDKNASELTVTKTLYASTTNLYKEVFFNLKEEYDKAKEANAEFAFDLTDIRSIAILPVVSEPITFELAGVALYTKEYLTADNDPEKQKITKVVDFDELVIGQKGDGIELPSNVSFHRDCYDGSREIVQLDNGANALQFNYDSIASHKTEKDHHQNDTRTNIVMEIDIPAGSLVGAKGIRLNMTNNGFTRAEQGVVGTEKGQPLKKNYVTLCATSSEGMFAKQSYNGYEFVQEKGVAGDVYLKLKDDPIVAQGKFPQSWCNPNKCVPMTNEILSSFNKIKIFISIPDLTQEEIDGFKEQGRNLNVQINSLKVEYDNMLPHEGETVSRTIVNGENYPLKSTNESTISISAGKVASNHPDYYIFNAYNIINAQPGNTAPAVIENTYSCFWRDAKAFKDTSKFRMYYQTKKAQNLQITIVNANNEKLVYTAKLKASKDESFDELVVSLKKIYDDYMKANPGVTFALKDIRRIEFLPLSGGTPISVADIDLWTFDPVNAPPPGTYHYETPNGDVRIDGYNEAIDHDFTAKVEVLDVEKALKENLTVLPKGAKALKIIRISMYNKIGDLTSPNGNFWVGFKIPAKAKINNLKIYEMIYDGSLMVIKRVSVDPDDFLSFNTIFDTRTYAILEMPDAEKTIYDDDDTDYNENDNSYGGGDSEYYPGDYEIIEDGDGGDGEIVETPTQETIVKRYKRKKKAQATDYTWLWILIAVVVAVVLIATGLVIFFIVRKKRKQKGDVTQ